MSSIGDLLTGIKSNPLLLLTIIFICAVIFINGWTDAPNAIATCVTTKALSVKKAVLLSAAFNFLGVIIMMIINKSVVVTIQNIIKFDNKYSLLLLSSALISIVLWSVAAWFFGIPTSESHALIAGLSGAAIALGGIKAINVSEWQKVIYGLIASVVMGFAFGYIICKINLLLFKNISKQKSDKFFNAAQIAGSSAMSFMHGAQDGQKFIGIFLLAIAFSGEEASEDAIVYIMPVCSVLISLGTLIGGKKIIKSVGMDMVKPKKFQGFSADTGAAICLFLLSLIGAPASTTHTKTTAVLGSAAAVDIKKINFKVFKEIFLAWILTFPICGILSFIITKIFINYIC
ncbi:inorganic phosphate transporter [Eubacteriales bacterium OttesenSCG-928-G02]|nr:inorganic phosphate transporter [Eubacteriales bacterium OttesenSCG-928-G02]